MKQYIEKNIGGKKYHFDPSNGEMLEEEGKIVYIESFHDHLQTQKFFKNRNQQKKLLNNLNEKHKEYGTFVWSIYNTNQKLFTQLKPSNITRLMFLSTYINYNGCFMIDRNHYMDKNGMFKLLNLSKREFQYFYNDMLKNNIFKMDNKTIYINKEMFNKGKLQTNKMLLLIQQDQYITRLYVNGIRSLYNESTVRSHKTLSYLFQILPYVNRQYNIICSNPLEENLESIKCMSLGEFCETIGYSIHNANHLYKVLFEPQFTINGKITTAMRYVVCQSLNKATYRMFINPMVYYAGNKWKEVEILGKF